LRPGIMRVFDAKPAVTRSVCLDRFFKRIEDDLVRPRPDRMYRNLQPALSAPAMSRSSSASLPVSSSAKNFTHPCADHSHFPSQPCFFCRKLLPIGKGNAVVTRVFSLSAQFQFTKRDQKGRPNVCPVHL
jgi:hypothetical protein